MSIDYPYPLTIIRDRYMGSYSRGVFTAWNETPENIPLEIDYSDGLCMTFWHNNKIIVGKGQTADEAIMDLMKRQMEG